MRASEHGDGLAEGATTADPIVGALQGLLDFEYEKVPFPAAAAAIDIGDYYGDASKFRAATGWAPVVGLEDGLARTVDYYRGLPDSTSQ